MQPTGLSKHTTSFGLALAFASVVNGLVVIAKESSAAVQSAMQKMTGSHWVTHVVIVLAVFLLSGWLFGLADGGSGIRLTASRLIRVLVAGVAVGALLILGFYLLGD